MRYSEVARSLVSHLSLRFPPSALAFVDKPPRDIPRTDTSEPSSCAFWRRADEAIEWYTRWSDLTLERRHGIVQINQIAR